MKWPTLHFPQTAAPTLASGPIDAHLPIPLAQCAAATLHSSHDRCSPHAVRSVNVRPQASLLLSLTSSPLVVIRIPASGTCTFLHIPLGRELKMPRWTTEVPIAPECKQDFTTLFASASISRPVRRRLTLRPLLPSPSKLLLRVGVGKQPLETALASGKEMTPRGCLLAATRLRPWECDVTSCVPRLSLVWASAPRACDLSPWRDSASRSVSCLLLAHHDGDGDGGGKEERLGSTPPHGSCGARLLAPYLRLRVSPSEPTVPACPMRHPYLRVPQAHTFTARPCWMTRAQMAAYPTPAPRLSPYRAVGESAAPDYDPQGTDQTWTPRGSSPDVSLLPPRLDLWNRSSTFGIGCVAPKPGVHVPNGSLRLDSFSSYLAPRTTATVLRGGGGKEEQEGEQPHPGNRGAGDYSRFDDETSRGDPFTNARSLEAKSRPSHHRQALLVSRQHVSPLRASPRRSVQHIGVLITPLHRARRAGSGFVDEEGVRMRDPPVPSPAADVASAVKTRYIGDCPQCPSSTVRGRLRCNYVCSGGATASVAFRAQRYMKTPLRCLFGPDGFTFSNKLVTQTASADVDNEEKAGMTVSFEQSFRSDELSAPERQDADPFGHARQIG
ncbi:hypothetical protein C8J57DRAFT_1543794 [Mycena rebaudengoi]|nr:hypothetical protein C8J57DRAFT_1543794 [Mycena rebaudengoi]